MMGNTIKRYVDGKWVDWSPPEYNQGGKPYQYAQPLQNSYGQGSVSPTYYQPRAPEPVAAPAPVPVGTPAPSSSWGQNQTLSALLNPQAPAATAATPNPFADRMAGYLNRGAPTAPTANSFADPLKQYLGEGGPQASTANSFADPLKQYLGGPAPTADKATMGTNRYAGGLTAAEQRLQDLITNPGALEQSAAYKFRFNQGQEALQRSLGAKGMLNSGNRLTELTKYGQDMGSQEYEAENARRKALFDSMAQNYNADETADTARFGVESAANNARFGIQTDQWKTQGQTLADLYKGENTANANRYATDVDLYGKRGTTLANLYGNEANAANTRYGTEMDAYSREGMTLADLYRGADTTGTQRYATDVGAASDRAKTLADLYKTDKQMELGWAENERQKVTPRAWWEDPNYANTGARRLA